MPRFCEQDDVYDKHWIIAAGKVGTKACTEYNPDATGEVSWSCGSKGDQFKTDEPDFSRCITLEIDLIKENVCIITIPSRSFSKRMQCFIAICILYTYENGR